jgi:putative oxidoreductase
VAPFVAVTETGGGALLIVCPPTPLVGAALGVNVLVALVTAHEDLVFFVGDGGIALELLLLGSSFAIALSGAGRLSADSAACHIASRRESAPMRRDASHEPGRADA